MDDQPIDSPDSGEIEFLRERAEKHRRSLLASCGIGVMLLLTGAVPKQVPIPLTGVQIPIERPEGFYVGLILFILYFAVAYWIEAKAGLESWKYARRKAKWDAHVLEAQKLIEEKMPPEQGKPRTIDVLGKWRPWPFMKLKGWLDFRFPVLLALTVIVLMIRKVLEH